MSAPVHAKVKAAAIGGAAGGVASEFVVYLLDQWPYGPGDVPQPVQSFVFLAVPAAVAFVAGYLKRANPADS